MAGEFYKGYFEGQEWAEEQAAFQAEGRELKIRQQREKIEYLQMRVESYQQMKSEMANMQRQYHDATLKHCKEIATLRAVIEDALEQMYEMDSCFVD